MYFDYFNEDNINDVKIISDHHFNHFNIIDYCDRPFDDVKEMNEVMIYLWNVGVDKNDIVLHLGDFSFGNIDAVKRIRDKLNGEIYMVKGNHDKHGIQWYENVGIYLSKKPFTVGNFVFSHAAQYDKKVCQNMINIHGHSHLSHPLIRESNNRIFYNVSVENLGYKPIRIEKLLKININWKKLYEENNI